MPSHSRLKEAVAYIRVSTERQGDSGVGFEGQRASILKAAELWGFHVLEWYDDVGSARHSDSLAKRDGVQKAIQHATLKGIPVLVDGLDRFSRDVATVEELVRNSRIEIISAKEGSLADPVTLASRAARAEREGNLISENTKRSLQEKKRQGVRLGNPTNLGEAQRMGAMANSDRAKAQVREIAAVIDSLGAWSMKVPRIVSLLNQRGIRTSRGLPWTSAALRPVLKNARELIAGKDAADDTTSTDAEDNADLRGDPNFGRF